jgi:drug/metabolite transporter (DMT)-like permease
MPSEVPVRPQSWRGILFIVLGGVLFSVMGAMAKQESHAVPTFELVAARSAVTLLVVDWVRRRSQVPLAFFDKPILFSRSFAGFIAIGAYFFALRTIPLGDAVLLNNASPALTALGAVLLLHERMTLEKAIAMVGSSIGVWLLVRGRLGTLQAQGAIIGALSALFSAWALVSLKVATRKNRSVIVVWCLAAMCTVGSLFTIPFDSPWTIPGPFDALLLLGTGVSAAFAQLLMTSGYRLLDASDASIYSYINPVFAILMGIAVFGDTPTWGTWTGGSLILGSGLLVALSDRMPWARKRLEIP